MKAYGLRKLPGWPNSREALKWYLHSEEILNRKAHRSKARRDWKRDLQEDKLNGCDQMSKREIVRTLIASTAHISLIDSERINNGDCGNWLVCDPIEYGFVIWVGDGPEPKTEYTRKRIVEEDGFSEGLWKLMEICWEEGCVYLKLDSDGEIYDDVPSYEW